MGKTTISTKISKPVNKFTRENLTFILDLANDWLGSGLDRNYINQATEEIYKSSRGGTVDYGVGGGRLRLTTINENGLNYTSLILTAPHDLPNSKEREIVFKQKIERAQQPPKHTRQIF